MAAEPPSSATAPAVAPAPAVDVIARVGVCIGVVAAAVAAAVATAVAIEGVRIGGLSFPFRAQVVTRFVDGAMAISAECVLMVGAASTRRWG